VIDTFSCADLERLSASVAAAWRRGADLDWSVAAGTLEWSCARTADHTVDTVLAPAFFLASRRTDGYPEGGWSPGVDAAPAQYIAGLEMATRITTAVVRDADAGVRAVLWRAPEVEVRGPEDFPPRAGVELALHGHDVCAGLGVAFEPPDDVCDRLRAHAARWPYWTSGPAWRPLAMTGDPWADLLRSSGRTLAP
jgi:hypothetical protein